MAGLGAFIVSWSRYTWSEPEARVKRTRTGAQAPLSRFLGRMWQVDEGAGLASGTFSGLLVGAGVAAVGITVAALVMDPVEITPVGEPVPAPQEAPIQEAPVVDPAPEPDVAPVDEVAGDAPAAPEALEQDMPAVEEPVAVSEAPVTDEPVTEVPVTEEPVSDEPVTNVPETVEAATDEPMADEPVAEAPEAEVEDPQAPATESAPSEVKPSEEVTDAAPDVMTEPAPLAEAPVAAPPSAAPEVSEAEAPAAEPEIAALPTVVAPGSEPEPEVILRGSNSTFTPTPPLQDRLETPPNPDAEIVTGRLPRIGDDTAEVDAVDEGPRPAIERNAVPYEAADGLPEMAVLLLDTDNTREDVGDLALMPFPLSVAVDASAPDAEAAIAYYRQNGAEVVLIVPLPEAATAVDVDVTFQAYDPLMQDIVAVMIGPDAGFQTLGDAALQIATNLDERGLGLVTFPDGLNTGHKSALKAGLPAGLVFRDLDGAGQAPSVIRRFLDNAAFKARSEDGVIAVARVRPDSIQALLEWTLGTRAQTVNFAPVSAVLPR